ncbi:resolvase [Candidatus Magnetomorum sp. HK-1]|nr:resolvase [Candidatus Magnetomorum sp. HK-1]
MAGQASARAKGKLGGRPKILDDKKIAFAKTMHKNKDISVNDICKTLNIGNTTFYRYINYEGKRTV